MWRWSRRAARGPRRPGPQCQESNEMKYFLTFSVHATAFCTLFHSWIPTTEMRMDWLYLKFTHIYHYCRFKSFKKLRNDNALMPLPIKVNKEQQISSTSFVFHDLWIVGGAVSPPQHKLNFSSCEQLLLCFALWENSVHQQHTLLSICLVWVYFMSSVLLCSVLCLGSTYPNLLWLVCNMKSVVWFSTLVFIL